MKKNKRSVAPKRKLTFEQAVKATPSISSYCQNGLKALEKDHPKKIKVKQESINGSVFIDECLKKTDNGNRWDYAIGYNNEAYFVEVHSANTSEISVVLKKLAWLKNWLLTSAPELNGIKARDAYHWIQSGKYDILEHAPQFKRAQQSGLVPKPFLKLG